MHEMSMAMRIIEIAVAEAHKAKAHAIEEIEVEVGQLAGVMAESLAFCLDAAARGTIAQGAVFTLLQLPGLGHCLACQQEVAISEFPAECPLCHGYGVRIVSGSELKIRSISVDEGQEKG